MGIRDRIRAWTALPDLPPIEEPEELILDAGARRLPLRWSRKRQYAAFGHLGLTDRRLLYVAKYRPTEALRDISISWTDVTSVRTHRRFDRLRVAPTPYFGHLLRPPIFTVKLRSGAEVRLEIAAARAEWRQAVVRLRILHPVLDPLCDR